jgi:hypothetical protein
MQIYLLEGLGDSEAFRKFIFGLLFGANFSSQHGCRLAIVREQQTQRKDAPHHRRKI